MTSDPTDFEALVPSDLRHLIPAFLENRQKDLHSLTVAIAASDFKTVRRIGHRMLGSGKAYGFPAISRLGMQIEHRAKVSDRAELTKLLAQYRDYLADLKTRYRER